VGNQVIDLCIGWGPWEADPFLEFMKTYAQLRKLSFLVCDARHAKRIIRGLKAGTTRVLFHLDRNAEYEDPEDIFSKLAYAIKDDGAFCVNEPDRARLANNKAILHYHLERAGIPIPYTIVVRNWMPADYRLTHEERKKLGKPFIVKPARGYGRQGVAQLNTGSLKEITRARRYDRGDDFLLQQLIIPEWFGYRMGWFRLFYVLGQIIPCWWDMCSGHYSLVDTKEFEEYELNGLCEVMWRIAQTAQMNFYSTELAISGKNGRRSIVAIDYVNDPPDMTLQTISHSGVPDRVVRHIAERLVDAACRVKQGFDAEDALSIWLGN